MKQSSLLSFMTPKLFRAIVDQQPSTSADSGFVLSTPRRPKRSRPSAHEEQDEDILQLPRRRIVTENETQEEEELTISQGSNSLPPSQKPYEFGSYGASYVIINVHKWERERRTGADRRTSIEYAGQVSVMSVYERLRAHKFRVFVNPKYRMVLLNQHEGPDGEKESLMDEFTIHSLMRKRLNRRFRKYSKAAGYRQIWKSGQWDSLKSKARDRDRYLSVKRRLRKVLSDPIEYMVDESTRQYQCEMCPYFTRVHSNFYSHKISWHSISIFCDECELTFNRQYDLMIHRQTVIRLTQPCFNYL